jgi:hypothetical protein
MRSRQLKERASVNDQIKILARVAKRLHNDPRHPIDSLTNYFNFTTEQIRIFATEYNKPEADGDDPLEV